MFVQIVENLDAWKSTQMIENFQTEQKKIVHTNCRILDT